MGFSEPQWANWRCIGINMSDMSAGCRWCERVLKREHQYHWSFLNKEKDFHKENTERPIFFYFEDDEDAIAFKLAIGK